MNKVGSVLKMAHFVQQEFNSGRFMVIYEHKTNEIVDIQQEMFHLYELANDFNDYTYYPIVRVRLRGTKMLEFENFYNNEG